MDLLKRSELPEWFRQRFGTVSRLAAALNTSRQTAHNLFTGRTLPNYENCQKLGLEPMFIEILERSESDMDDLENFLAKRSQNASVEQANQARMRLIHESASSTWNDLLEAIRVRAGSVGKVDDVSFEWNPFPFLQLGFVAATFSHTIAAGSQPPRFRVVFGRIPIGIYPVERAPAREVWDLELSIAGKELVWNIPALGRLETPSSETAEQVIKKLIEYRDKYQAFYAAGSWLTP